MDKERQDENHFIVLSWNNLTSNPLKDEDGVTLHSMQALSAASTTEYVA